FIAGKKTSIYLKPRDVWEELRDIRENKKEHFVAFYLDTRNQEIKRDIVSIGTLNYNLVHPREVFEPAVRNLAAGIIVAHNHPSGCLEPSDEDLSLNRRLVQAGKLLGIELLDHVIVTKDAYSSFKQRNLM
ncbi:MAG TPA: JAB domain-containing protein, partial [Elusimicrobiales bacterium]|nr:JAB domain-containing protein [Elusimicrobiales bacterium]